MLIREAFIVEGVKGIFLKWDSVLPWKDSVHNSNKTLIQCCSVEEREIFGWTEQWICIVQLKCNDYNLFSKFCDIMYFTENCDHYLGMKKGYHHLKSFQVFHNECFIRSECMWQSSGCDTCKRTPQQGMRWRSIFCLKWWKLKLIQKCFPGSAH